MRIGPLGCLGMLVTGVAGWAAGRLPAMFSEVASLAPPVQPAPQPIPAQPVALAAAPSPIILTAPAAPPPQVIVIREGGGVERRVIYERPAELGWTLPVRNEGQIAPSPPAATPVETSTAPVAERASSDEAGFALASLAYADLGNGDKKAAAQNFANALALAPKAENAPQWRKELKRLRKRWSGEAYTLLRDDGPVGLGLSPVLGGGQSSAQLAYTPRPLSKRPVSVVLRTTVATRGGFGASSVGTQSSQVALGAKWQVLPMLSVSGERLFAVRNVGRSAWTVRLAGGVAHRFGPVLADAYGEAGILGFGHVDPFAGAQGRAVWPFQVAGLRVEPGVGAWAGWQRTDFSVGRFDFGPTVGVAWDKWNVRATADYRLKVAGNARPGTGPAVTVSGAF